ncbi:MAG: response regulator [Acidobacteria bacterium]|nr:response regulator [Acidobacteriota bacterium]
MRITLIYAVIAALWILLADQWLTGVFRLAFPSWFVPLQTAKDVFAVLVTSALLFILIRQSIARVSSMDRALRESEERYGVVVSAMREGIVLIDALGIVRACNGSAAEMFGSREKEMMFRSFADLCRTAQREDGTPFPWKEFPALKALQSRQPNSGTVIGLKRADSNPIWVSVNCQPLYQAGLAGPYAVLATFNDITESRRTAEALRKSEEEFRQAQKMKAVGRLAGGVAHDFNNLLTIINGQCELLLDRLPGDDPHRRHVQEALRAGERAAGLTRQLLAFSRKQVLAPRVLDVNDVLADLESMLRRLIGENIHLEVVRGEKLWLVKVDAGQIEQVLLNLAVNAQDAMLGGGRLWIRTSNVELATEGKSGLGGAPAGRYVLLEVSDTGHGIDAKTQARIFEPFFTTKGEGKGTGLGLSMVYGFMQQSGGYIAVESAPGQGATFRMFLPCAARLSEEAEATQEPAAEGRGSGTILIVEDEHPIRSVACELLERSGYTVLVAATPSEAVALARHHAGRIDLLLSDVVMPEKSGPELARELLGIRPELAVLFMSGYTHEAIGQHAALRKEGAVLFKPFSREALTRKVREALGRTASPSDASNPFSKKRSTNP